MKSEHINIKKMAIPFLSLVIASQAAGCGSPNQNDIQNTEVVLELPEAALTQAEIADLDIDWGEGPYPIYKYDWDYESDWKEIYDKSNDDYQLELKYCEEKCPEKVITASYIDGYFEWKEKYIATQVRTETDYFKDVDETVYATETVNIRVKPDADSDRLSSLSTGQSIRRLGIGTDKYSKWSEVEFKGQVAYINSNYLSTTKPAVQTAQANTNSNTSKPQTVQNSKPQTAQNSKPSNNYGYVEPDVEPIVPEGVVIEYGDPTAGELVGGTEGNDYSHITVQ